MRTKLRKPGFEREKFKELVLLLAGLGAGDDKFGATKLNKLLFFCDILAYKKLGHPITGADYMRLDQGPVPRQMIPVRDEMVAEGSIEMSRRPYFDHEQIRIAALRDARRDAFTDEEIALIERVVVYCRPMGAAEISEVSHRYVGWKAVANGDSIPYQLALVANRPPTDEEIAYAESLQDLAAAELARP